MLAKMPIFGADSTTFDEAVENVTAETMTSENWALMVDICDKVSSASSEVAGCKQAAKQCLISIKKRLNHRDPHVVLLALSLLDCLWNNCGPLFRREVSSKEFINELNYKATNSNRIIAEKTRLIIKKWVDNECKTDASLSLIGSLYKDLLNSGYSFESSPKTEKRKSTMISDPNVVSSEQEEADIAKAIALSLEGVKSSSVEENKAQFAYPSLNANTASSMQAFSANSNKNTPRQEQENSGSGLQLRPVLRQVRALYDFEAVEDNELSFCTNDLINVCDDRDANWWRGCLLSQSQAFEKGIVSSLFYGLFPVSFVEVVDPTKDPMVNGNSPKEKTNDEESVLQIDESVLLKCIQLLQECDPAASADSDPLELASYERSALAQATLIDSRLYQIDKQLDMLAQMDVAIRDVLTEYDDCVRNLTSQAQLPNSGINPQLQSASSMVSSLPSQTYPVQSQMLNPVTPHTTVSSQTPGIPQASNDSPLNLTTAGNLNSNIGGNETQ